MIIQPFFKEEFAVKLDDKLILDWLADRAMRSAENIRDIFGRLNKVNCIIMDAYKGYTIMPAKPMAMSMAMSASLLWESIMRQGMKSWGSSTFSITTRLLFQ